MSLNPLTIAHLGIARRPLVAALLGIWDELMGVLQEIQADASASGGLARRARGGKWSPHTKPVAARHWDRDEEVLLLVL